MAEPSVYDHPGVPYQCQWRGDGWVYRDSAGYEHACVREHPCPECGMTGGRTQTATARRRARSRQVVLGVGGVIDG